MAPVTNYARSGDGTNIAYQVFGDGPVDLVLAPGWTSHLEMDWVNAEIAQFLERLGAFARVIRFDKRGTGLSDRPPVDQLPPLEVRMDDLRAVMDAARSPEAALFGYSDGGPMCILFAATHPARTTHLILYGTHAVAAIADDTYSIRARLAADVDAFAHDVEARWGEGFGLEDFAPELAADAGVRAALARRQRASASPAAAAALARMSFDSDVADVLSAVSVPTLVLHRKDDQAVGVAHGQFLARHIPGATYIDLAGSIHYPYLGDSASIVASIEEFITGQRRPLDIDRVLTTVMFTDIVDSTARAAAIGDHAWRQVLERFRLTFRGVLDRYRGLEINTRGDDFLATFDGPARAIRCAGELAAAVAALGIELHTGIHTGEVERLGDDITGLAVHVGARVAALAGRGEIWTSRTVRDLVAGAGITFEARGEHTLKGVPGTWALFAAKP